MIISNNQKFNLSNFMSLSSNNYLNAVPLLLLVELKVLKDIDSVLDDYLEMIRVDNEFFDEELFTSNISISYLNDYIWCKFLLMFSKLDKYQKSYCFWWYLEHLDSILHLGLARSYKGLDFSENFNGRFQGVYQNANITELSSIYGSTSKKLKRKKLKKYLKDAKPVIDLNRPLSENSVTRLVQIINFHLDTLKDHVFYTKEEVDFELKIKPNLKIIHEDFKLGIKGIYNIKQDFLFNGSMKSLNKMHFNLHFGKNDISVTSEFIMFYDKEYKENKKQKIFDTKNEFVTIIDDKNEIQSLRKELNNRLINTRIKYSNSINGRYDSTYSVINTQSYINEIREYNTFSSSTYYNQYRSIYTDELENNFRINSVNIIQTNDIIRDFENFVSSKEKKKKQKRKKLSSTFKKSYTFLTKILSLKDIQKLRGSGIIVEGKYFDYKFKIEDSDMLEYSDRLNNISIKYDFMVLEKESHKRITSLCIVYPGAPILDEISSNILFIKAGEEDKILEKANFISKNYELFNLHFIDGRRMTEEEKFEKEFNILLEEEEKNKEPESDYFTSPYLRAAVLESIKETLKENQKETQRLREKTRLLKMKQDDVNFIKNYILKLHKVEVYKIPYWNEDYFTFKYYKQIFKERTLNPDVIFGVQKSTMLKEKIISNNKRNKLFEKKKIKIILKEKREDRLSNIEKIRLKGVKWKRYTKEEMVLRKAKTMKEEVSKILLKKMITKPKLSAAF